MKEIPKHGHGSNTIRRDCYKARDKSLFCFPALPACCTLVLRRGILEAEEEEEEEEEQQHTQRLTCKQGSNA
jgi:hypothetical protein